MCERRPWRAVLLLGAGMLLAAGSSRGQRSAAPTVIATSVPMPAQSRPTPTMPAAIQQVSFTPDPPPPAPAPPPRPMRNGLLSSGLTSGSVASPPPMTTTTSDPPSASAAAVSVDVRGPDHVPQGQPLRHEIIVRNIGGRNLDGVRIEEPLPPKAQLLTSDPPGKMQGDRLTWDLGHLEAGGERHLKVEVRPGDDAEMHLRPYVVFTSGTGLRTQVVRPPLSIDMKADHPKTTRGGRVTFDIRVFNNGNSMIHNVKLYDRLPPELRHPAASERRLIGITNFGDLAPGQSRPIALETTAIKAGRCRNEIIAQADGGLETRGSVDVEISEAALALDLRGPKQGRTRQELDFQLEVANPGPMPAAKVRVVQSLPRSFEVIASSSGGGIDEAQHALVWSLYDLAPGQRQMIAFRVKVNAAGEWPLYSAVSAENVPESRKANVLRIDGSATLTLEIRAGEESLAEGEETECELHVFNEGDAASSGVRLTAWLPDAVTPLEANGPTHGQIQRQQVSFAPLESLPPGGNTIYRVRLRAGRGGSGPLRVELAAEHEQPLRKEISLQIRGTSSAAAENSKSASARALR